jgi:hypothetical protein
MKLSLSPICLIVATLGLTACGGKTGAANPAAATSQVNAVIAGKANALPYAVFFQSTTPGAKQYAISLSDWDVCVWSEAHSPSLHPKTMKQLGLYLLDEAAGAVNFPNPGVYNVGTPAMGATGKFIDPAVSGFSIITSCQGNYPTLASGTVTLSQVNNNAAAGSLNLTFSDGTKMTGTFTTAACSGAVATKPPANDPDACPAS